MDLLNERATYRLEVTPRTEATVGQASQLDLSVRREGVRVQQFDPLHGHPMHLVAASFDLEDFQHVHPVLAADGFLSAQVDFARPAPYTLFAEVAPAGDPAGEVVLRRTLWPVGARSGLGRLDASAAFDGQTARATIVDDTRVCLAPVGTSLHAGAPVTLRVEVTDPRGAPVELEEYQGLLAHAIAISEDSQQFLHFHGAPASAAPHAHEHRGHVTASAPARESTLLIDATFPEWGLYKLWVQLQRAGRVITAPFVVRVG